MDVDRIRVWLGASSWGSMGWRAIGNLVGALIVSFVLGLGFWDFVFIVILGFVLGTIYRKVCPK